jgi:hypothetical protein
MAELTETARQIRKRIMDQVLSDGTAPTCAELREDLGVSTRQLSSDLRDLEAAICVAIADQAHAGLKEFQDEPLEQQLPAAGEIFYARPFAAFKNHYPVWVDGQQHWYAECAVEACAISAQFPGAEVIVRSVCRQTKQPVELLGRDGILLDYSPKTLRVHLGHPVREIPNSIVGWCDHNNFFASEDAARQWAQAHPDVKGITRDPESLARAITEVIGNGRLEYSYQPPVPVLKMLRNLHRYGFTRRTRVGLPVPDPFWLPTPSMLREWKQQGLKNFFRFSLR